jgi:hypothetical protein
MTSTFGAGIAPRSTITSTADALPVANAARSATAAAARTKVRDDVRMYLSLNDRGGFQDRV